VAAQIDTARTNSLSARLWTAERSEVLA